MSRKRTIIDYDTFNRIISYHAVAPDGDRAARNTIKMSMLKSIIDAITVDKWYRIKPETRKALENYCFLAIERGFAWCSPEYSGERYGLSALTVRRHIAFLEKHGIISRLWRSSSKHNGRGCMVIFFHAHPYFEKFWRNKFFSDVDGTANDNLNDKAAEADNMRHDAENESLKVPTINQPDFNQKDLLKDRSNDEFNTNLDLDFIPDYVDKNFSNLAHYFWGMDIKRICGLWRICKRQADKMYISSDKLAEGAVHALKQTVGAMKAGRKIKNFAAYFTATARNIYRDMSIFATPESRTSAWLYS